MGRTDLDLINPCGYLSDSLDSSTGRTDLDLLNHSGCLGAKSASMNVSKSALTLFFKSCSITTVSNVAG
ncbi:hypothetical protein H5410_032137 [Solanum commersonii]|uniref:Uncharacterized protein n=1 Tax=Solanum commersonii TaxID=4109 RepID=A0A9J5YM06_SOLCO|nr:hypothetical protein H5410_032137 [Solanum commersonii]